MSCKHHSPGTRGLGMRGSRAGQAPNPSIETIFTHSRASRNRFAVCGDRMRRAARAVDPVDGKPELAVGLAA